MLSLKHVYLPWHHQFLSAEKSGNNCLLHPRNDFFSKDFTVTAPPKIPIEIVKGSIKELQETLLYPSSHSKKKSF